MSKPPQFSAPSGARDRMRSSPDSIFAKHILAPIFEFNCRHYFAPLIAAHRAWIIMLHECGIVDRQKATAILAGLDLLEARGVEAIGPFDPAVEYFYLHAERALTALVPGGESVLGDLNLGRTRPEPLSRMVLRNSILRMLKFVLEAREILLVRAEGEADTVMPGYTHLQHAQPTTFGHYLLAIHDHLERDTDRLWAAFELTDHCTLGCGAMSGTSLAIDRERVRELLGFGSLSENTLDSVAAEDHVTASAAALAGVMTILGRMCQDLYVWSSQEFRLIDLTDAFSSPSSLMPQKKNALVLEYLRSHAARVIGALGGCFGVFHNVGYMDTEEVEYEGYQPLLEALTLAEQALVTIVKVLEALRPDRKLMKDRAAQGFSSVTALAEALHTRHQLSYRTAHRIVARTVLLAVEEGIPATSINPLLVNRAAAEIIGSELALNEADLATCLDPGSFVQRHAGRGACAPEEVRRMIKQRLPRVHSGRQRVKEKEQALQNADSLLRAAATKVMTGKYEA
jgi:argininosuccinate lyase